MRGSYYIKISNRHIAYDLVIERNITIIKGDSGTGKTNLIKMLRSYLDRGVSSGIKVNTNIKSYEVLEIRTDWKSVLSNNPDTIYFVDEGVDYVLTKEFYNLLCSTGSYLVCINRSGLTGYLQYSISSIVGLEVKNNSSLYTNIFYNIYQDNSISFKPDLILTEDSTSGLDMLRNSLAVNVESSYGKDNMVKTLRKYSYINNIYIIIDGAAFGNQIQLLLTEIKSLYSCNILIFAPESFEWLILNTSKFKCYCKNELSNTSDYVEPSLYKTWENYFEDLLINLCNRYNYVKYEKVSWDKLNPFFKNTNLLKEIVFQLTDLDDSIKLK